MAVAIASCLIVIRITRRYGVFSPNFSHSMVDKINIFVPNLFQGAWKYNSSFNYVSKLRRRGYLESLVVEDKDLLYLWSVSWWRHQIETFSALLAICAVNSPVPGEFPAQRPVTRSFDVFFDLRLNKRLSKQSWGWWFEMLSRPLWRHRNVLNLNPDNANWGAGASAATLWNIPRLILGLRPANARRCYLVTTSLIGWAQA